MSIKSDIETISIASFARWYGKCFGTLNGKIIYIDKIYDAEFHDESTKDTKALLKVFDGNNVSQRRIKLSELANANFRPLSSQYMNIIINGKTTARINNNKVRRAVRKLVIPAYLTHTDINNVWAKGIATKSTKIVLPHWMSKLYSPVSARVLHAMKVPSAINAIVRDCQEYPELENAWDQTAKKGIGSAFHKHFAFMASPMFNKPTLMYKGYVLGEAKSPHVMAAANDIVSELMGEKLSERGITIV